MQSRIPVHLPTANDRSANPDGATGYGARLSVTDSHFCIFFSRYRPDTETHMNLRHAAALAIAWYLMIPPVGIDNKVDAHAPLSQWRKGVKFDSEQACDESLTDAIHNPMTLSEYQAATKATLKAKMHPLSQSEMTRRTAQSVCISADDPRLKK
jgi:hypothetical protein